jgi:hypothetical protein
MIQLLNTALCPEIHLEAWTELHQLHDSQYIFAVIL